MYHFLIIFIILFLIFGLAKPKCTRTENPFSEPKFSWGLAAAYSLVLTLIFGTSLFLLVPPFKKSVLSTIGARKLQPDAPGGDQAARSPPVNTSKDIVSGIFGRDAESKRPTPKSNTVENSSSSRLSIRPFAM